MEMYFAENYASDLIRADALKWLDANADKPFFLYLPFTEPHVAMHPPKSMVESYPEGIFDEVAVQGVNQWRFEPANYQGKAVRAWARQRVRFDLS